MWSGVVWCCVVLCSVVWCGVVRPAVAAATVLAPSAEMVVAIPEVKQGAKKQLELETAVGDLVNASVVCEVSLG